jgi:orotate phosphoribosyltransferase-like protein
VKILAITQIKSKELAEAESFSDFLSKLGQKYGNKWVVIVEDGTIVTGDTITEVFRKAEQKGEPIFFTQVFKEKMYVV